MSDPTVYFHTSSVTVSWDDKIQSVLVEWRGSVPSSDYRTALTKGLDLLELKRSARWLADTRRLLQTPPEDQRWALDLWFPRAHGSGLRAMAVVVSTSIAARQRIQSSLSRFSGSELAIAHFDTPEHARMWLLRNHGSGLHRISTPALDR